MSFDHTVALVMALIAFFGVPVALIQIRVALIQMRDATKQRRREALNKVFDVNRELLSLGFWFPELFDVMNDKPVDNAEFERRYLQLWLNQMSMIHENLNDGGYDAEAQEGLERNIADLMTHKNMQRHWQKKGWVYSPTFQDLVNNILTGLEAPDETPRS